MEREESPDKNFWQNLNRSISYFLLDDPFEYQKLIDAILNAQKEGKILLIEIKVDPAPGVIQLLKEISHFGSFNLHDARGKIKENIKIFPGSILVIAKRDFIEKEISYPRFYDIFETAIILE